MRDWKMVSLPVDWKNKCINPLTPKFKKYILPTFQIEIYEWGSQNL